MPYQGNAVKAHEGPLTLPKPSYELFRQAVNYRPGEGLVNAVNVSLLLGQPLLVTGEPGTGKTRLAYALARELGLGEPLECFVKSTTTAKDLFYSVDELGRFRDAQANRARPLTSYITFNGLGKAILFAGGPEASVTRISGRIDDETVDGQKRPEVFRDLFPARDFPSATPVRRVVLVDEMDKAPRDTPNDMLNEIERMGFDVPELGIRVQAPPASWPILVITSNSEKSLPDPFLRRCVYYDIPFPDREELLAIVYSHLEELAAGGKFVDEAIELFELLRDRGRGIRKPPGTAELLSWLRYLVKHHRLGPDDGLRRAGSVLESSLPVLIKTKDDQRIAEQVLEAWLKPGS